MLECAVWSCKCDCELVFYILVLFYEVHNTETTDHKVIHSYYKRNRHFKPCIETGVLLILKILTWFFSIM
jgi:hypothetical protein